MQRELMLSTDPASGEWMADLVFFSKTGLLDLERQIQFQTKEIEDMVSGNRQISESLASVGALQDDDKDILRPTIRLASCPTGFDDLFLTHIYGEITAAHSKLSNRSHGSKQQRDRGDVGGGSGVGEEEDQACLSREAVDDSFRRRMAMLKASQSTNFASKELGAAVVFSNMLTSPSYAPPTSGQPSSSLPSKNCTRDGRRSCDEPNAGSSGGGHIAETMRHVLGLKAHFPPPDFVITPEAKRETRPAAAPSSPSSSPPPFERATARRPLLALEQEVQREAQERSLGERQRGGGGSDSERVSATAAPPKCWAFGGGAGRFTVQLSRPVVVTHVSLEQPPPQLADAEERSGGARGNADASATPKRFRVWGLSALSDAFGGREARRGGKEVDPENSGASSASTSSPSSEGHPRLLGEFEYSIEDAESLGQHTQTFTVSSQRMASSYVTLDVLSNHGVDE